MNVDRLRVVLDTSVLVSTLLTRGEIMRQVMGAWEEGEFVMLFSPQTRAELIAVLAYPEIQKRSVIPLEGFAESLARFSLNIGGKIEVKGVCRDAKDDKFLACAVEGNAQYLVSSDRDLLEIGKYQNIPIINPGQFLVALQLARLSAESMRARFSQETIKTILAETWLDARTREVLVNLIAASKK
jgi:putative PIN family toxin of toxin-antitoxin system